MSEERTIIREARPDELHRLFEMGLAFYEEMKLPGTFKSEVALSSWQQFMRVLPSVIFVAEHDEKFEGMLGAIITPDHYDARLVASEMFWYVDPGAPRTPALLLLRAFHRWAKANAAVETRLTHMLMDDGKAHDPDRLKALYGSMGYVPIEVNYLRKVRDKEGD